MTLGNMRANGVRSIAVEAPALQAAIESKDLDVDAEMGVSSSCFMLLYGIVSVSLALNYLTEVRRAPVMGESVAAADAT